MKYTDEYLNFDGLPYYHGVDLESIGGPINGHTSKRILSYKEKNGEYYVEFSTGYFVKVREFEKKNNIKLQVNIPVYEIY